MIQQSNDRAVVATEGEANMATLEEMRRWLQGEDVSGLPTHKKSKVGKPFNVRDLFSVQTLPPDVKEIQGEHGILTLEQINHDFLVARWIVFVEKSLLTVDIEIGSLDGRGSRWLERLDRWLAEGHRPTNACMHSDNNRRMWQFTSISPMKVESSRNPSNGNHIFTWVFKYASWLATGPVVCLRCKSTIGVELENSRTQYEWDGEGADPNAPIPLCRGCAKNNKLSSLRNLME